MSKTVEHLKRVWSRLRTLLPIVQHNLRSQRIKQLEKEFSVNSSNKKILFDLAEEWYAEYTPNTGDTEKAREYLSRGFASDIDSQSYFNFDRKLLRGGKHVLIIKPKHELEKTDQCLDGFSYYSFLLLELLSYLIVNHNPNLILDMKNVKYLGDCGDGLLLGIKRDCLKQNGDLQCANVSDDIKEVGELMEWWPKYFGFHDSVVAALKHFEDFEPTVDPNSL